MISTVICLFVLITLSAADLSFVFPHGEKTVLTGYIWVGTKKVYVRPRLQVISSDPRGQSVCGVRISPHSGGISPFYAKVTDEDYGFVDLLLNETANTMDADTLYSLEAYDCGSPPSVSERVNIQIHVVAEGGPFFPQPSYTFTISRKGYADTSVGQVQAISQPSDEQNDSDSAICGYYLSPTDTPFAIDRKGVIRIQRELEIRPNDKPYMLQVTAEDCHRPTPRRATVGVIIRQIADGCQAGWTGLPTYLEYRGSSNRPEKLLQPYTIGLEFCVSVCDVPEITARIELQSAVKGLRLETASPQACRQDPEHLLAQQILCGIHPTTLNNFLPSPDQSIASQLSGLTVGSPPKLLPPIMAWRFNASQRTAWQVDRSILTSTATHGNAFDSDFTVSFWLRRNARPRGGGGGGVEEAEEESVVCSQDRQEPSWRFMSIGFKKCQLVVRLLSSLQQQPSSLDREPRQASVWTFDAPLPIEDCSKSQEGGPVQWHHYAVTFNRNPWATPSEPVSLLVDGRDMGSPSESQVAVLPPFRPAEGKAEPIITIGACFDPETNGTTEHANVDVTGLAVLTERAEAANNLRCVAHCGESLIVPDVMKYLKSNVLVDMEDHAITVSAQNTAHVIELLQAVAYVRPQAGVSHGYSPHAIQTRVLSLTTSLSCTSKVELPSHTIKMNVYPEASDSTRTNQPSDRVRPPPSGSIWIPENAAEEFSRAPIAQADMEKKAWAASQPVVASTASPPPLLIDGSDIVLTEPPVRNPGIQIFSDIQFLLPDEVQNDDTIIAAAAVPLDACLIWIASAGVSSTGVQGEPSQPSSDDGYIEWSVKESTESGLTTIRDKHGVQFRGQQPAGNYERLLRTVHYWPPQSVLGWNADAANQDALSAVRRDVRFVAKIGLTCSSETGQKMTPQFFVNVVVEPADIARTDMASDTAIRNLSPDNDLSPVNFAHSNRERQSLNRGSPRLSARAVDNEFEGTLSMQHVTSRQPSVNNRYVAIGLSVTAVLLIAAICLVIGLYVHRNGKPHKPAQKPGRRRRFPAQPADFGGSSLKHDPTLCLTANPIGELEYRGIGIVSEDLYGSCKNIAPARHIFSPMLPESQQHPFCPNARLAGFDDFDEDYVDGLSDGQSFNEQHHHSQSSSNLSGRCAPHHSQTQSVADVHDWIDEEDSPGANYTSDGSSDEKCNVVVTTTPDEAGSPVADL